MHSFAKSPRRIDHPAAGSLIVLKMNGLQQGPRTEIAPNKVTNCRFGWYGKQGVHSGLNLYNNHIQCKDLDPIIKKLLMMVVAEHDTALPPSMSADIPDPTSVYILTVYLWL